MLFFVVPVKGKGVTRRWDHFSRLVERTLRSICRQSSSHFRVIVAYTDMPDITFAHPSLTFLQVDQLHPDAKPGAMDADKTNRILTVLEYLRKEWVDGGGMSPDSVFVMPVDSDDFVSRRLAGFVREHPNELGWVFEKGYLLRQGGKLAYLNRKNFHHSCGSSAIFRLDVASSFIFEHSREAGEGTYCRYNFEKPLVAVPPLPFAGAIYNILNGENIFLDSVRIQSHKTREHSLPYYLRKALKYVPVPVWPGMRAEFGLDQR
jgi:hypothetical protein